MLAFITTYAAPLSAFAVAVIDLLVNVLHPNPTVTGVLNWVLPFLRAKAGPNS